MKLKAKLSIAYCCQKKRKKKKWSWPIAATTNKTNKQTKKCVANHCQFRPECMLVYLPRSKANMAFEGQNGTNLKTK